MVETLAAECGLYKGDLVYVRSHNTQRAALASVVEVTRNPVEVHLTLATDYYNWDGPEPKLIPAVGAYMRVPPSRIEDLNW